MKRDNDHTMSPVVKMQKDSLCLAENTQQIITITQYHTNITQLSHYLHDQKCKLINTTIRLNA